MFGCGPVHAIHWVFLCGSQVILLEGIAILGHAELAMGQNPNRTPSEHPNPTTKIGFDPQPLDWGLWWTVGEYGSRICTVWPNKPTRNNQATNPQS